jgi:hypothetical protein
VDAYRENGHSSSYCGRYLETDDVVTVIDAAVPVNPNTHPISADQAKAPVRPPHSARDRRIPILARRDAVLIQEDLARAQQLFETRSDDGDVLA